MLKTGELGERVWLVWSRMQKADPVARGDLWEPGRRVLRGDS